MKKFSCLLILICLSYCKSQAQNGSLTTQVLTEFFESNKMSGVVFIQNDGMKMIAFSHGDSDEAADLKNNINTTFNIGSITKIFTATLIMQLVEKGIIFPDQRIGTILPDFFINKEIESITFHQLPTHSSGLGDYLQNETYQKSFYNYRKLSDYSDILKSSELDFKPGDGSQYSNTGMLMLGYILEKLTNKEYEELLIENICNPLGMDRTRLYNSDDIIPNRAIGFIDDADRGRITNQFVMPTVRGTSAGGSYSSAPDLAAFYNGLLEGKLVNKSTLEIMLKPHVKNSMSRNPNNYNGYAFSVNKEIGYFGHSGGGLGISNFTTYYQNEKTLIIILMNSGSSRDVRNFCLEKLGL